MSDTQTPDHAWSAAPIVDWLLTEGRFLADIGTLTSALGERLLAVGAPVSRLRISVRLLHPLLDALSAVWVPGGTEVTPIAAGPGLDQRAGFVGSPLEYVARTGQPFRRRLADGLSPDDHAVLHEIAATGATDYLALRITFTERRGGSLSVATDRTSGFDDNDIASYQAVVAALAPCIEARVGQRLAETLVDCYIGPHSGRRVLAGRIRRGDVETVRAAIWFSDIRGWSRIANERPPAEAVAIANAYFELIDEAITSGGGELLKLIGDATLAIFPVEADGTDDVPTACRAAVGAARRALDAAAMVASADTPRFGFGIGLHLGDVVYGNVGSQSRLDFTVMGAAVNLAARVEKLTRTLAEPMLLTADFARACGLDCRDLGAHPVAGWDRPVRVYGPPAR